MKIHPAKQGTPDWLTARLGIPTSSNMDRIITPKGNPSSSGTRYLARLCAEWYLGQPLDEAESQFMARGSDLEHEAVRWYEFETGLDTAEVGLCLRDDGKVGASPDRLVGEPGLLEIKCPSADVHMMYVLGGATDEYRIQTQGQLYVTERLWVDLLFYHPTLPRAIVRITRDEAFIAALAEQLDTFVKRLEAAKLLLGVQREAFWKRLHESEADNCPAELTP